MLSYRKVLPYIKTIKLLGLDARTDDYSHYLSLDYRQKLLRVVLVVCFVILVVLTIVNFLDLIENPGAKWGAYNLASDGAAFIILFLLYQANEKGFVAQAGWLFGLMLLATVPLSYSMSSLNQTFLLLAVPIAISSFLIQPWVSFLFACLAIAFYSFTFIEARGAFEYDVLSLSGLCLLAVCSYLVSSILNKAISDSVHAYDETIQGWAKALEMRDAETLGHSQRVVELTLMLARKLGVKDIDLFQMRRGALLHDIGKMGVPDGILNKPDKLTEDEWAIMRKHPVYARDYLSEVSYLAPALDIPYFHHEKWDGTGYPEGLKGESIPFSARVFAIVDVWDALTSNRPYRQPWSRDKTLAYIQEQRGKHFDPRIVDAFVELMQNQKKEDLQ
jgi:putative nucleotidyltransferase with HDIG domain